MRVVGIKTLKDGLREHGRLAAAGETVLVTQRDRVVAQLGPVPGGRGVAVAGALHAARAMGMPILDLG